MSFDDLKNNEVELSDSDLEQVNGTGGGFGGWGGCCGGWGGGCCGGFGGFGGPFIIAQQNYCAVNYAVTYSAVQSNSYVMAYLN